MKSSAPCTILSIAALSYCSLAAFTLDITRSSVPSRVSRRNLARRATIGESILNNLTAGSYMASVSVGTPPQQVSLILDTGSSDVWLLDASAALCTNPTYQAEVDQGGCITPFYPAKSSSYVDVDPNGFDIEYADGSEASGDYITDDFTIGGTKIKSLEMGLALDATVPMGIIGVGYDVNEASAASSTIFDNSFTYPSIIDSMVNQSLISTKAYSLFLNDLLASTGSILFGGIDTEKYHGQLLQLPIVTELNQNDTGLVYAEFLINMTSFSVTGQEGNTTSASKSNFSLPHLLDSGTTFTYLPYELVVFVYEKLGAIEDLLGSGIIFVDCDITKNSPQTTLNFGFGNAAAGSTIKVPIDEVVFPLTGLLEVNYTASELPFTNTCALGIFSMEGSPYILGDSFLRSAYVLYDLKNNLIGIAQTNFNSTTNNVIDIAADATAIPTVTGAPSSTVGTTATGSATGSKTGSTTGSTTGSATGSGTGSATGTSKKSAAAGSLGPFDVTALAVLGVSSVFAIFGGGWFLA